MFAVNGINSCSWCCSVVVYGFCKYFSFRFIVEVVSGDFIFLFRYLFVLLRLVDCEFFKVGIYWLVYVFYLVEFLVYSWCLVNRFWVDGLMSKILVGEEVFEI